MSSKGISVVIPNYNGIKLLPEILPPLLEELFATNMAYEIIVSDDASTDGSVVFLKNNFPQIRLAESNHNQGFSKTINKGIFMAQFDWVLLLNSDVKLTKGYFEKQFKYFDRDDTFGVMGRMIGWDDDSIQDGGKYPSFHGMKIKTGINYTITQNSSDRRFPSFYLSGANALVCRQKLFELQGFDELYSPYYVEDVDLSVRAWRKGWKCYYEPEAVCRHKTSVTIGSKDSRSRIRTIYYRNKMYLQYIHLDDIHLLFWFLQLLPELFLALFTGKIYLIRSFISFVKTIDNARRSKKNFRQLFMNDSKPIDLVEIKKYILKELNKNEIRTYTI